VALAPLVHHLYNSGKEKGKGKAMSEQTTEKIYPVKTLHEFLSETNREWRRFKRGTMMSLFVLSLLLTALVPLVARAVLRGLDVLDVVFLGSLAVFLIYDIYIMAAQYRFFKKWGHRMEQLTCLEEKILTEQLEGQKPT
jgi:hypothetical protein